VCAGGFFCYEPLVPDFIGDFRRMGLENSMNLKVPEPRKVIQIFVESRVRTALFALCDDGSVWVKYFLDDYDPNPNHPNEEPWQTIEDVPQTGLRPARRRNTQEIEW